MAKQKNTSKVGRNRTKCERYRARNGRTIGSKKPKKPGSNSQQRSYLAPVPAPISESLLSDEVTVNLPGRVDVGFTLPKGGGRLVSVPREWVR